MSKIIVCIHGMGNKPPGTVLSRWWQAAIQEGLEKYTQVRKIPFVMVNWAHLLHSEPEDPNIKDKKHPLFMDDPYLPADNIPLDEKPSELRQKIKKILGNQLEHIFLNDDLSINFSSVSDFVIQKFFSDVGFYYQTIQDKKALDGNLKQSMIRSQLADLLYQNRHKRIMLVAHSMGAIIAYDVLAHVLPQVKIDTLITFGCPLGLPTIRGKIASEQAKVLDSFSPLRVPDNIQRHWYNMYDLRDKIAIYDKLADYFRPNLQGVSIVDQAVINNYQYQGKKNPHKSYGYLRTREMAVAIEEFMLYRAFNPVLWMKNLPTKIRSVPGKLIKRVVN